MSSIYFIFRICIFAIVSVEVSLPSWSRFGMRFRGAALGLSMANTRFQYVKKFELSDVLLPDTYLVTRLDGHRFTKFTAEHGFTKPNDERGLLLMAEVMSEWSDLVMAFGQSDEFSFLLPASSSLYGRRSAKLSTSFVSLFSSSFVFFWPKHFPDTPLLYPPNFDARVVSYPSAQHVRDYISWRQADCHINNLYNTCFWALVGDGVSKQDAQVALKGTSAGDKNELLFSRFGINYNEVPQRFRKGTTLCRSRPNSSLPVPQPQPPKVAATLSVGSEKGTQHQEVASGETLKSQTEQVPTGGLTKMSIQDADLSRDSGCGAVEHGRTANGIVTPTEAIVEPSSVKHPDNPKAAGSGVVRVVTAGGGTSRSKKRLIKKGHAPPGAIEEHACDLIRDDFWDRNPHILGESTLR